MNVTHDSFTIERTLDASPERVFEALSKPEVKAKWFVGPSEWKDGGDRRMDFRVGGTEHLSGTHASGMTSVFDAHYFDIVPNERIVYAYEMIVDGKKISTSLATFVIERVGSKTRLVLTEQGVYFGESHDKHNAMRREGTEGLLDQLVAFVHR
jgi:uncharacterized protein YndB with AHSA1/START domain